MKAKEYFNEYKERISAEGISPMRMAFIILVRIHEERKRLYLKRNPSSLTSHLSILQEVNDKWEAFARLVNDESKAGVNDYKIFIHVNYPLFYDLWMNSKK